MDQNRDDIVGEVTWNGYTLYVTEQEAFPIGFAMSHYLYEEELTALPQEQRAMALMQAAVIRETDEKQVASYMQHIDTAAMNYEIPISDLIHYTDHYAVQNFTRSSHGFTCTTSYETDQVGYFTVPYSEGWTATIDGVEAGIIDSGGMMLLPVSAGEHQVIFTYHTPGLRVGVVVSILSFVIFAAYTAVVMRADRRQQSVVA